MKHINMDTLVWRKMTPDEYADKHKEFGKHVAVSQETVEGCQEVWVFLGQIMKFSECDNYPSCSDCDSHERGKFNVDYDQCLGCGSLLIPTDRTA
jgi:hypothetical protein